MGQVAVNLAAVRARIAQACAAAGRDPASVRLLPVSKTHGLELIDEAYAAGCRLFGENRVQEATEKAAALSDRDDLGWAMIGHLQSNKAREVAAFATEFHALDSLKIARTLDRHVREAGRTLDVFVQVNSSEEPQKFGFAPEEVEQAAEELGELTGLHVRGLMTLAVFSEDQAAVGACFARMRDLQARLQERDAEHYAELSMGMSGDFELAIGYGATTVRVGQAIFGQRE